MAFLFWDIFFWFFLQSLEFGLANDELWGEAIVVLTEQCLQMPFPGIPLVCCLQ